MKEGCGGRDEGEGVSLTPSSKQMRECVKVHERERALNREGGRHERDEGRG